jgi:ubiquinone/menaquinone biosynthesis C-methylase UbiE
VAAARHAAHNISMPKIRPAHYLLGVQGLALLRNWFRGEDTALPLVEALTRTLGRLEQSQLNVPLEMLEMDVADGYAAWSSVYDTGGNPLISAEEPVVQALIDRLPAGRALDAACGTGRHTQYLHSRGHQVAAIDMTPGMLGKARVKVPEARFALSSLTELPFAAASFDLAVCSLALEHTPDLASPISELARVVRPGGATIISDFHPMNRLFNGGAFFRSDDGRMGIVRSYFHDHAAYVSAFVAAGFEIRECIEPRWSEVEVKMITTAAAAPDSFRTAMLGTPLALVWLVTRR